MMWLLILLLSAIHQSRSCGFDNAHHDYTAPDLDVVLSHNLALRDQNNKRPSTWNKVAITNVGVFDGWTMRPAQTVVIENGRIGDDLTGAIQIDGSGHTFMPGLIDSHSHPSNITHLQSPTEFGATTAMVMSCPEPLICDSLRNHKGLTDVLLGSTPAAAARSIHGRLLGLNSSTTMANASQSPSWVDDQIENGADFIKMIAETPDLSQDIYQLLRPPPMQKARLSSAMRPTTAVSSRPSSPTPLDETSTRQFLQKRIISTPTLIMMLKTTQATPKLNYTASRLSTSRLYHAEVEVLVGTDANDQVGAPAKPKFGISIHDEMELLVEAGLPPVEVLRGATARPADIWGLHDRGVVEFGRRADLVLVKGNPIHNISATRNIRKVWVSGEDLDDARREWMA
ncbi:hypothetical protein M409DRAFT_61609 [Zasmidium cellare ATCC 36951]|uniref:Amidohydrolase-related domain-containing protein n=1 Tax=Zasmidium cellare ATCC 36951 TaxID=1080233 RepID=A0A6A6BYM0_ZASCE|nr:uncharacterized protein M409DRAFT_61609 [Zasmidium cellare ATCC 36951]KAF2158506.1 hypothetical protein M409DRAFT_61609 [Zasmidium cellare ATCC 36951]